MTLPRSRDVALHWSPGHLVIVARADAAQRPRTCDALESCLAHRAALKTSKPDVIVTKGTKLNSAPASLYYMTHVLDSGGLTPKQPSTTRPTTLTRSASSASLWGSFIEGL